MDGLVNIRSMGGEGVAGGSLLVGLLGPVEVASPGGRLAGIAQPLIRVLLGMLAISAGRVVPDEALVEAMRFASTRLKLVVEQRSSEPTRPGLAKAAIMKDT